MNMFAFKCKLCGEIVYSNTTRKSSMWCKKCRKSSLQRSKKNDKEVELPKGGIKMNKNIIKCCSKEVDPDLENTYILPSMLPSKPDSWPIVTDCCKKCRKSSLQRSKKNDKEVELPKENCNE